MLWFFKKGDERIHYEIRPSADGTRYELEWQDNGETKIVSAADPNTLVAEALEIEQRWKREGWTQFDQVLSKPTI